MLQGTRDSRAPLSSTFVSLGFRENYAKKGLRNDQDQWRLLAVRCSDLIGNSFPICS